MLPSNEDKSVAAVKSPNSSSSRSSGSPATIGGGELLTSGGIMFDIYKKNMKYVSYKQWHTTIESDLFQRKNNN